MAVYKCDASVKHCFTSLCNMVIKEKSKVIERFSFVCFIYKYNFELKYKYKFVFFSTSQGMINIL